MAKEKLTFLGAEGIPLTKGFVMENEELVKKAYPNVSNFTSYHEEVDTIEELFEVLKKHRDLGHCFLKGNTNRQLTNESRAGSTSASESSRLFVYDVDKISGLANENSILEMAGAPSVDHIIQYSASMGIDPAPGASYHVFAFGDRRVMPGMLKLWFQDINLTNPILRSQISLTRTGNALHWPLDITVAQSDKIIYLADATLGPGVKDKFKGERIQLRKGKERYIKFPEQIRSAEIIRIESEKVLNELRVKQGLPERKKMVSKSQGSVEYFANPDRATVTGIKTERGFTYLNINGGDSWGYYHPEDNPEFISNFKGEPVYKTSELLPDYWAGLSKKEKLAPKKLNKDSEGSIYLAFRDFKSKTYWNGIWHEDTKTLKLAEASGRKQLEDFLLQYGQYLGKFVPDWDITFNPQSEITVDSENQIVNTHVQSEILKRVRANPRQVTEVPPTIKKDIMHASGNDEEFFEWFMNWLACIVQYMQKNMSAPVFYGTEGTGKGVMMDRILMPIFGVENCEVIMTEVFEGIYNGFMEHAQILFVDEAEIAAYENSKPMAAKLRNYITESIVKIRKMHTNHYNTTNFTNIIFASNEREPVKIKKGDRRYSFGKYQPNKLILTHEEIYVKIPAEVEDFAHYLMTRVADKQKALTPLENEAKKQVRELGESAVDQVCDMIVNGDLQGLWDMRQMVKLRHRGIVEDETANVYIRILSDAVKGKMPSLVREEIQLLLGFASGTVPMSPHKFTSFLRHHKIFMESIIRDGQEMKGIKIEWQISDKLRKEILNEKHTTDTSGNKDSSE